MFHSSLEFPLVYSLLSPHGRWYLPLFQGIFVLVPNLIVGPDGDLLSTCTIKLLGMFLYGLCSYRISGTWKSVFICSVISFLRNPFTFTFGQDSESLLNIFYLLFSFTICTTILLTPLGNRISVELHFLRILLAPCIYLYVIYSLSKNFFVSTGSFFQSISTTTYIVIGLLFCLLIFICVLKKR